MLIRLFEMIPLERKTLAASQPHHDETSSPSLQRKRPALEAQSQPALRDDLRRNVLAETPSKQLLLSTPRHQGRYIALEECVFQDTDCVFTLFSWKYTHPSTDSLPTSEFGSIRVCCNKSQEMTQKRKMLAALFVRTDKKKKGKQPFPFRKLP